MIEDDFQKQLENAKNAFTEFGKKVHTGAEKGIAQACILVERDAKINANQHSDTGILKNSITHVLESHDEIIDGFVGSSLAYAAMVEFGTSPHQSYDGHEDFIESVTLWCHRHGINDPQHIHNVIKHIQENGTKAYPYLYPAYYANKDKVVAIINEAIAKERLI